MRDGLKRTIVLGVLAAALGLSAPALAQTFNSGSTGADGPFNPTCAPTPCTATIALPVSGTFNFTTISVNSGITVKFHPNANHTPVTMLASGQRGRSRDDRRDRRARWACVEWYEPRAS